MAVDLSDPETRDYLGNPASLTLSETADLPVGGLPAAAGAPAPGDGGEALEGSTGGDTVSAGAGVVSSLPEGGTAIPGNAMRDVSSSSGSGGGNPAHALIGSLLRKLFTEGAEPASAALDALIRRFESGGSSLDAADYSLSEDSPESVLGDLEGFGFDIGSLRDSLPDLLTLRGLFDEAGAGLSGEGFSLFGDSPESTLSDTGGLTLGADTSIEAPDGAGVSGLGGAAGSAASVLMSLGRAFGLFGDSPGVNAALTGLSPLIAPLVSAAVNTISTGVPIAQSLAAGLGSGAFMAAWNAPQIINSIDKILQGDEQIKRRFQRSADAMGLQADILGPLSNARTPEELTAALNARVGDVRSGDALASILRNNLSGTWYTDTAHNWLPDLSLVPMYEALIAMGYSDTAEPTKGDVGGVGEIVAGGGHRLIDPSEYERGGRFFQGVASDEGGQMSDVGSWGLLPGGSNARALGSPGPHATGGASAPGALGWENILRRIARAEAGPSMVSTPLVSQGGVRNTSDEGGGFIDPATGENVPVQMGPPPGYIEALKAYNPEVGAAIDAATQRSIDDYFLQMQGGNG